MFCMNDFISFSGSGGNRRNCPWVRDLDLAGDDSHLSASPECGILIDSSKAFLIPYTVRSGGKVMYKSKRQTIVIVVQLVNCSLS